MTLSPQVSQEAAAHEAEAAATRAEGAAIAGVEEERRRLQEVQETLAGLEGAGEEIATHTRAAEVELEELVKEKEASVVRIQKIEENIAVMKAANLRTAENEKAKEVAMRREEEMRRERRAQWMASLSGPGWARSGNCHSLL